MLGAMPLAQRRQRRSSNRSQARQSQTRHSVFSATVVVKEDEVVEIVKDDVDTLRGGRWERGMDELEVDVDEDVWVGVGDVIMSVDEVLEVEVDEELDVKVDEELRIEEVVDISVADKQM